MTTERTTDPISLQAPAIEVLAELAHQHAELPSPYVTIHRPWMGKAAALDLSVHTPTEFNEWLTVLGIAPEDVQLHLRGRDSWLEGPAVQAGVQVTISVHGILLTTDQVDAPRILSEVAA
ncbi:MAG: hypothetical protein HOZ81_10865 [Streptomyces sp.]|nr:hypothetical protein [Streptomyces sp.]NUS24248.1 hypothetical protein [Streptomyces sp.]